MGDQDPEESPESSVPEGEKPHHDAECDINSPLYHAPNRCDDKNCLFPQCDEDDGAYDEVYPGERIWWKTYDNWNNPR